MLARWPICSAPRRSIPSAAAPLTAEIPFTPDTPGTLTIALTGPASRPRNRSRERFSFTAGKCIQLPILGLCPDCANSVAVTLFDEDGHERGTHTATIDTAPLPDDFPVVTAKGTYSGGAFTFVTYYRARVETEEDEAPDDVPEVIENTVPEITGIMFDKAGRVRWYSDFTYKFLFPMEFIDGYIYGGDWVTDTGILQWYDLMGRQAGTIDIGGSASCGSITTSSGSPMATSSSPPTRCGSDYIEDHLIEVDPADGNARPDLGSECGDARRGRPLPRHPDDRTPISGVHQ